MKSLNIMKQLASLQARSQEMQERLAGAEVTGVAGAGLVSLTLNGKGELRKVKIDPKAVDPAEVEVLEDLILAAFNDAKAKTDHMMAEETRKLTGGLPMPPGFKLPFG